MKKGILWKINIIFLLILLLSTPLLAKAQSNPVYILRYHSNNADNTTKEFAHNPGEVVNLDECSFASDDIFIGWSLAPDGSQMITSFIMPNIDYDIYAIWQEKEETLFTLTYNGNFDFGIIETKDYQTDQSVDLSVGSDMTKENYTFAGWALSPNAKIALSSYNMPSNDVTLYAVWLEEYSLVYNPNGGVGSLEEIYLENQNVDIYYGNIFKYEGYILAGWSLAAESSVIVENMIMPCHDVELYAVWEADPNTVYSITFYNTDLAQQQLPAGNELVLPSAETNDIPVIAWEYEGITYEVGSVMITPAKNIVLTPITEEIITTTEPVAAPPAKPAQVTIKSEPTETNNTTILPTINTTILPTINTTSGYSTQAPKKQTDKTVAATIEILNTPTTIPSNETDSSKLLFEVLLIMMLVSGAIFLGTITLKKKN